MNMQSCDPIYECSEMDKSNNDKIVFFETNSASIKEKSINLLSNSFEVMSLSDDANSSQNFSCSNLSHSESEENQALTCPVLKEIRSTREKLTFEWVKSMTCEHSIHEFDSSSDCSSNSSSDDLETDSETDDSADIDQSNCMESSPDDVDIVFVDDSKDSDLSELTFCFADAVTEENCDSGFSFSTRGSLANCIDDDFLEDNDFELVFSTPPLNVVPGWADIITEASELSQGLENEEFVDLFDLPAKSKALKKVNERWEIDMCGVDGKPREPVQVTFAPLPDLVTIHCYQKTLEENLPYDTFALDWMRFQNRIKELSKLLSPILTLEHRTNIILRNSLFTTHD